MAAGTPVVCLDAGGPAVHTTSECGIKIDPDNPDDAVDHLAEALERLYQDPDLRESLGRAARTRAEEVYHWDRLGERLMGIYEDTFGAPGAGAAADHSN
jgi:glycosyltransferase involved in cell wall biosynthesis